MEPSLARAPSESQRRRFVALLERFSPATGPNDTPWPGLHCYRAHEPTVPDPTVYAPSICVVGQGAKEAQLGDLVYRYDPFQYLVARAHMPVRATVVEASAQMPFLSLSLEIDASAVNDVLLEMEDAAADEAEPGEPRPLGNSPLDGRQHDALVRFLTTLEEPMDRKILAPAAMREIVYLALLREQGDVLREAARRTGRSSGVDRALHYIRHHLDERIDVPTIAREVGMSTSSLHHAFKSATTLTPIQYLKRLRLHRARQLMVDEGCLAAEAAFRVGYESPSQFSREFKRLFGAPPRRYVGAWSVAPASVAVRSP
jgi:AraC-like DNA-binding protein